MPHFLFRALLLLCLASLAILAIESALGDTDSTSRTSLPVTGDASDGLEHLDGVMLRTLEDRHIPGASLAIAKDGKLLLARGYGYAHLARREPVQPTSLFNLASCTKAVTAAAVLRLVDDGKLNLDDPVFAVLARIKPHAGTRVDPQIRAITVRQLLHHAGGLSRGQGASDADIARRLGVREPINVQQLAAFTLTRPLDYDPGTRSVYSNLGFLLLRPVVTEAACVPYDTYTFNCVLKPMGITDMHLDRMDGYSAGEVSRYVSGKLNPAGHTLRGGGCWLASTVDMMRFLTSLDGTRGQPVLSKKALAEMLAPLPSLGKSDDQPHTGLGWDVVRKTDGGILYHKNGAVAGISTYIEHLPNGVNWAVFFNGTTGGAHDLASDSAPEKPEVKGGARRAIRQAIEKTTTWPAVDLFEKYPGRR